MIMVVGPKARIQLLWDVEARPFSGRIPPAHRPVTHGQSACHPAGWLTRIR
jgi:hypothetical protein